jgi:methanogenic corrinoid protein MtbC1
MQTEDLFKAMAQSITDGEADQAAELAKQSIEQGIDPLDAINKGFVNGVNYVGDQFSCGNMYLPELVMAGEAMKAAVAVLEPELARRGTERKMLGKVVLCTVEGDIHEIGKTLVGTMLSATGFQVFDMGVDVPIMKVVHQKDVVEALEDIGLRDKVKVMVGGAPVTQEWVKQIGADGYSEDAIGAARVAKQLMGI